MVKYEINKKDITKKIKYSIKRSSDLLEYIERESILPKELKVLICLSIASGVRYKNLINLLLDKYSEEIEIEKLIDIASPVILSRGIPSWFVLSEEIIDRYQSYNANQPHFNLIKTPQEAVEYCLQENKHVELKDWQQLLMEFKPETLVDYSSLRKNLLIDNLVQRKYKELVLMAINYIDFYQRGYELHIQAAKNHGLLTGEVEEVLIIAYLIDIRKS